MESSISCSKCGTRTENNGIFTLTQRNTEGPDPENHERSKQKKQDKEEEDIVFKLDDKPSWLLSVLLGLQHFLIMAPGTISSPLLLFSSVCLLDDNPAKGYLLNSAFFVCGLTTLLQINFGSRLPIVQGPSFAVLFPILTTLSLPKWECPEQSVLRNMTQEQQTEEWHLRIRETEGALILGSVLEIILGLTGAVGVLMRFITPLVVTPIIVMIGFAITDVVAKAAGQQWAIAGLCVILIVLMSQYLRNVEVPVPLSSGKDERRVLRLPIFSLFPIVIAMGVTWIICIILTAMDVFEEGDSSRTDRNIGLVYNTPWFFFPYPGQFGKPTFSLGSAVAVTIGIIVSVVESVGDYQACARLSGAPPPPSHSINRGILLEGIGSLISGIYGTGGGSTSFSQNIAAIGITRVSSRRVMQIAAMFMLLCGVFGKLGAVFITFPDAIYGGVFICAFGMISAVGLSTLQYVNLNSSRNLFILGFSMYLSMVSHDYLILNPDAINTGSEVADGILVVFLKTKMFSSGVIACVLDNTVPGTDEERGLTKWRNRDSETETFQERERRSRELETYNLPCMGFLKRWSWTQYIPFSHTYKY